MAKKKKQVRPPRLYSRAVETVVEKERGKLANALAVLQTLNLAMDAHGIPHDSPFWPSVVDVAMALVRGAFNGLDSVNVEDSLKRPAAADTDEDSASD